VEPSGSGERQRGRIGESFDWRSSIAPRLRFTASGTVAPLDVRMGAPGSCCASARMMEGGQEAGAGGRAGVGPVSGFDRASVDRGRRRLYCMTRMSGRVTVRPLISIERVGHAAPGAVIQRTPSTEARMVSSPFVPAMDGFQAKAWSG
jgi:hypothetical protein